MKKVLSLLFAIALMVTLAVTVAAADTTYELWVAGEQVTSDNLNDVLGDGTVSFDPTTNTLTLNNFSYTGEGYAIPDTESGAIIYSNGNLNLKLTGASSITYDNSAETVVSPAGLFVEGDLTVTDDSHGSLTATAGYNGIHSDGNLTIPGGNTSVKAIGTDGDSIGIHSNGNLTIDGGIVTVKGSEYGIMSQYDIIINSGTLEATASGEYGIGIVANAVTVNGGTVEAISTGECGYGITTYDGVSCNGDFDVYAGEATPGELVTSPTASTYHSKYVKIVPAQSVTPTETQSTTITYQVAPAYTVTIPATVTLGTSTVIMAENVVVPMGMQLEVSITSAGGFKLSTEQGAELTYTVENGDTVLSEGDVVLAVNPTVGKTGSTTLTFVAPARVKFAGEYKGTITFTIAVNAAVNN